LTVALKLFAGNRSRRIQRRRLDIADSRKTLGERNARPADSLIKSGTAEHCKHGAGEQSPPIFMHPAELRFSAGGDCSREPTRFNFERAVSEFDGDGFDLDAFFEQAARNQARSEHTSLEPETTEDEMKKPQVPEEYWELINAARRHFRG